SARSDTRCSDGPELSLRLRLTLLYSLLFAVLIGLFGTIVYLQTSSRLYSSVDDTLSARADRLSAEGDQNPRCAIQADQSVLDEIADPGVYVEVLNGDGSIASKSSNLSAPLPVSTRRRS